MEIEIEQEIFIGDVKREPSVEYVLILPLDNRPAPEDGPAPQAEADVAPKRQRSQKSASSSKAFKCGKCSYQANRKTNLTRHEGTHHKSIECETCQKKFATSNKLKNHQMQHKHGIYATAVETFDCDKCDKWFSTSQYLKDHQRKIHDDEEVQCNVCDKVCKNRKSLSNHSRAHFKVECSICSKMILKSSMASHVRTHTAETFFECDICGSSFKTKTNLKRHIERVHLLQKLVSDSECCKDFGDFELLEKLQRSYGSSATMSEKKFKCNICSRYFVTPDSLNHHKRQVHVDKTFQRETCKKAFKSKDQLNVHTANVHSKVCCTICKKKVGQRQLKTHMKCHQLGHYFECDLCGFKTEWKKNLALHMESKHHRDGLEHSSGYEKVLVNAIQASPSSPPGGPSDNNPDPVPYPEQVPRASIVSFIQPFVNRIDNLPPLVQRHFQRDLRALIDGYTYIDQNVQ